MALLSKEFNEQVSNNMKVAFVTSMMPPSIQDYVYTSVDCEIPCEASISKIWAVVGNKVAMMTKLTPMDIGYATTARSEETAANMTFTLSPPTLDVIIAMVGDTIPASAHPRALGLPKSERGETRRARRGMAKAAARLA